MSGLANKSQVRLLESQIRTTTQTLASRINNTHRRAQFILNVTGNPGGVETLTLQIFAEPLGGAGGAGVSCGAIVTTAATNGVWMVALGSPGTAPSSNSVASPHMLPVRYYVQVVHSAGGNWTYTLDETLMP